MKRLFNPLLFLMASAPNSERNLEMLLFMLQSTTESIKNIKSGVDSFHASILNVVNTPPTQNTGGPNTSPAPEARDQGDDPPG